MSQRNCASNLFPASPMKVRMSGDRKLDHLSDATLNHSKPTAKYSHLDRQICHRIYHNYRLAVITWFAFQKMLCLITSDLRHRCEDMCTVCGRTFNAVAVINTTITSFLVNVKLQVKNDKQWQSCQYQIESLMYLIKSNKLHTIDITNILKTLLCSDYKG